MKPVVLVGHLHECPLHGAGVVETGSETYQFNGKPVARVGDHISCGAQIETGATHFLIDGKCVTRQGDRTSHGGTLVEGDSGWLLD